MKALIGGALLFFCTTVWAQQDCMKPKIDYDISQPMTLYSKPGRVNDSRREIAEYSKDSVCAQDLTEIACTIMSKDSLKPGKRGEFILDYNVRTMGQRYDLCMGERFSEQLAPGTCSCFLTADNEVTTAGHCFPGSNYGDRKKRCENSYIVFGFNHQAGKDGKFKNNQVFECNDIDKKDGKNDPTLGLDVTRVKLQHSARNSRRKPLNVKKMKEQTLPSVGKELCIIGSSFGGPLKVALGQVQNIGSKDVNGKNVTIIQSDMDGMAGASGSMVVDCKSGQLVGIYLSGAPDIQPDPSGEKSIWPSMVETLETGLLLPNKTKKQYDRPVCNRPTFHPPGSGFYESIMWIGDVPDSIWGGAGRTSQAHGVK